jgi:hypothetical protein
LRSPSASVRRSICASARSSSIRSASRLHRSPRRFSLSIAATDLTSGTIAATPRDYGLFVARTYSFALTPNTS